VDRILFASVSDEVLEARRRESVLTDAAAREDSETVKAWVDERWPSKIETVFNGYLPQPGPALARSAPEAVEYAGVVHNRFMDDEDGPERVARIVMALLTSPNVDEWARAEVYLLAGPGWNDAAKRSKVNPPTTWLWSVESGNHRLIAQHTLSIGPYAIVRDAEYWS
jgi:hypothetical protein